MNKKHTQWRHYLLNLQTANMCWCNKPSCCSFHSSEIINTTHCSFPSQHHRCITEIYVVTVSDWCQRESWEYFSPVCLKISRVPSSLRAPLVGVGSGTQSPGWFSNTGTKGGVSETSGGNTTCRRPSHLLRRPPCWLETQPSCPPAPWKLLYLHINR